MSKSALEETLAFQIAVLGLPLPVREFQALPPRKWRWDFGWLAPVKLLVECNGATWVKGGHSSGSGLHRDYEKHNAAMLAGWRTLVFDRQMIDGGEAIEMIKLIVGGEE